MHECVCVCAGGGGVGGGLLTFSVKQQVKLRWWGGGVGGEGGCKVGRRGRKELPISVQAEVLNHTQFQLAKTKQDGTILRQLNSSFLLL